MFMAGHQSDLFWRFALSILGLVLILIAIARVTLFFAGEITMAEVNTRREGGAKTGRVSSQRYDYSVDYSFVTPNGVTYDGHTVRRGSDIGVTVEKKVYYFSFAPYINALEKEAEPGFSHLILFAAGAFLLFVMNKGWGNEKRRKNENASNNPI